MGRPLKSVFKKEHRDDITNRSANPVFSEVAEVFLSRRRFLQMGAVAGAAVSFPFLIKPDSAIAAVSKPSALAKAVSLGFTSIPVSTDDTVRVPEGYIARPFYRWGDPTGIKDHMPAFKPDASNTTDEQAVQAGMHHDGMAWFSLPQGEQNPEHGLLALNHEYIDNGMLFTDGMANWNLDKARKGQNAMGVSVVEVKKTGSDCGSPVFLCPSYHRQYADAAYRPGAASAPDENRRRPAGGARAGHHAKLRQRPHAVGHLPHLRGELVGYFREKSRT